MLGALKHVFVPMANPDGYHWSVRRGPNLQFRDTSRCRRPLNRVPYLRPRTTQWGPAEGRPGNR